ncbi:TniQ family protein [Paenibacillus sp. LjRoot153]|uniref:TniQ family protein n=1 Tax=Paenibacillus sp. LjRoot153 TaxID=3342270 RepID=UPI003ECDE413
MDSISLTIRPRVKSGECLTSYLFRAANSNKIPILDIWRYIQTDYGYFLGRSSLLFRLEYDIHSFCDKKILNLLKKNIITIISMTFFIMSYKFFDDPESEYNRAQLMINAKVESKKRKFCPVCLSKDQCFQLIWQVKEIEICYKHLVNLQTECQHCYRQVEYWDNVFINEEDAICLECMQSLTRRVEKIKNEKYTSTQIEFYKDWIFLLNPDKTLTKLIEGFSLEQSIAIKVLFLAQSKSEIYNRSEIKLMSLTVIKNLISLIRGTAELKKVSIGDVLSLTRYLGISLEEFSVIKVPDIYVSSLTLKKEENRPKCCLANWCKMYKKEGSMNKINNRIEPRMKGIRYPNYYYCTYCSIRYGFDPANNNWQEIDGNIQMLKNVEELVNKGLTRSEVSKHLKINFFRVSEIFGYLAFHGIFSMDISRRYIPKDLIENSLDYFKSTQIRYGSYPEAKYKETNEKFGWSLVEYSYYFADNYVQAYLMEKESDLKKPLKKYSSLEEDVIKNVKNMVTGELTISLHQVAMTLECSVRTLNSRGLKEVINSTKEMQKSYRLNNEEKDLREKFDDYMINAKHMNIQITYKQIYKHIGKSRDYIFENYPGFFNYLTKEVNSHKAMIHENEMKKQQLKVKQAVYETFSTYGRLNLSLVGKQMGIKFVCSYPIIKKMISLEIASFFLLEK